MKTVLAKTTQESFDKGSDNAREKNSLVLLFGSGFFVCMITMELALEGANQQFRSLQALPYAVTLFQFGFCFLFPLVLSKGETWKTFPRTVTDCMPYVSLSLIVFGSTCLASMSVQYVSFVTKVVFKSAKLIPTMVVAAFLQRGSRYGVLDYVAATLLCAGAAGYALGQGEMVSQQNSITGITLLLVSVFCDAFTPNIQQRLMAPPTVDLATSLPTTSSPVRGPSSPISWRRQTSLIGKIQQLCSVLLGTFLPPSGGGLGLSASTLMTNANGVGCAGLILFMLVRGSLVESVVAISQHPELLGYLVAIGLSLSTAVFCYTRLIEQSGSVTAVAIATIRKVATVVLSYVVYPKPLSTLHAVSAGCVVGGIFLGWYTKHRKTATDTSSTGHTKF